MNNTTYYVTCSLLSIDACWKLENKQPVLIENGIERTLPKVNSKYKPLLDQLNISYIEKKVPVPYIEDQYLDMLEIRDMSYLEEEELTLPIYSYQNFKYKCINPHYRGKTYTRKSIEKAKEIYYSLSEKMKDFDQCEKIKSLLNGKSGIIVASRNYNICEDMKLNNYAAIHIRYKDKHSDYIGRCTKPYLTCLADLSQVDHSGNITIMVKPEISIGKLVGERGWQAKLISEFLGVKHVTFKTES